MLKKIVIWLLVLFFIGVSSSFADSVIYNRYDKYAVSIFSIGNGGIGRCSGVLIKEEHDTSYVLTAKHCVDIDEEIWVQDNKVRYSILSSSDDIAMLIVNGELPSKIPVVLGYKNPEIGEIVWLIGFPNGKDEVFRTYGKVLRKTDDWEWARYDSRPGTSGGGVYNIEGELVGINWGGFRTEPMGIYEPIEDIKKFLDEIGYKYE